MTQPCVLTYHSLDASDSVISVRPEAFRAQMEFLVRSRIPVVPVERVSSTPGSVAITFDDGFQNFYEHAYPVLKDHGLPATIFVVTGACGRSNDWAGQPDSIPRLPLMGWRQLKEVAAAGIELGAHTVTHPRLSELPVARVENEWDECREEIEQRIGKPVTTAAYPYGDSSPAVRSCAAQRFRLSYGTRFAPVSASSDSADLPRLDMFYFRSGFWFESLWKWHGGMYVNARGWLREIRRKIS